MLVQQSVDTNNKHVFDIQILVFTPIMIKCRVYVKFGSSMNNAICNNVMPFHTHTLTHTDLLIGFLVFTLL